MSFLSSLFRDTFSVQNFLLILKDPSLTFILRLFSSTSSPVVSGSSVCWPSSGSLDTVVDPRYSSVLRALLPLISWCLRITRTRWPRPSTGFLFWFRFTPSLFNPLWSNTTVVVSFEVSRSGLRLSRKSSQTCVRTDFRIGQSRYSGRT